MKNLLDSYIQHLASKKDQIRGLIGSFSELEGWLKLELFFCLDYLCHVNRYRNLLGEIGRGNPCGARFQESSDGTDVVIRGNKRDIYLNMGYLSTGSDLKAHLPRIRSSVTGLIPFGEQGTALFVQLIASHGKWANRAIQDCVDLIQDGAGIRFERYSPWLILTRFSEHRDPLEPNVVLRLFYSFVS